MGAALGYLAPGSTYAVHFHHAIEQLTFVVKGAVELTMRERDAAQPTRHDLRAGDAITNPPGATLEFANSGDEPAEVLFVCAPPFPSDGADVQVVDGHRPLSGPERALQTEREDWVLRHVRGVIKARHRA